jgi:digeranylgeranylglycerophospholipid reductase
LWEELDCLNAREGVEGKVLRRHGGIVPLKLREQLEYGNVLLAGDAAGCASPLHGGGIDTSFSVGKLAARWIAGREGLLPDAGKSYSAAVWDLLRPKLVVEEKICSLWSRLDRPALDAIASLATRDRRQMRLWGAIPCSWLLLRHLGAGYRLWAGLARGRWQGWRLIQ